MGFNSAFKGLTFSTKSSRGDTHVECSNAPRACQPDRTVCNTATTKACRHYNLCEFRFLPCRKWGLKLFWNVTQRLLLVSNRRFGKSCRSHLQGKATSSPLKMGPIVSPETSVTNEKSTLRNFAENQCLHISLPYSQNLSTGLYSEWPSGIPQAHYSFIPTSLRTCYPHIRAARSTHPAIFSDW